MSTSRLIAVLLSLVLLLTAAVAPVAANGGGKGGGGGLPTRIDLPDGFQPEGIESWGSHLYAGSLVDGAIWKADARTGKGRILVPGVAGRGRGRAAPRSPGAALGRWWTDPDDPRLQGLERSAAPDLHVPDDGLLNDLDITRNAVYATDSLNQQLAVVPLGRWGKLPPSSAAKTMPLSGDIQYTTGFNANGIAARGGYLILVQSNTGLLFRVNPRTGQAKLIDTGGYSVTNGDGLEVQRQDALRRAQPAQSRGGTATLARLAARSAGRRDHLDRSSPCRRRRPRRSGRCTS